MEKIDISKKVTLGRVMDALREDNNLGFCLACGELVEGVEPDARRYKCECCGMDAVFGAEEILLHLA